MEYNHSENFFQNIPIDKNRKADFSMPFHFPAKIYETDLGRKPFGTNAWHWHDELQFCIVTSGSLCVTVCQQKYELQSGEGIFINSGCIHMTMSRSKDPAQYLFLNIHPQMFSFFHGSAMEQTFLKRNFPAFSVNKRKVMNWKYILSLSRCGNSWSSMRISPPEYHLTAWRNRRK